MADAQVLGVVRRTGSGPRVSYVNGLAPVTQELLDAAAPAPATAVLRFAARCETSRCRHYDGAACTLGSRIARLLPEVADSLPPCTIRRNCRWFAEQGSPVCLRCPQVVTQVDRRAADPRLVEGIDAA
jgi:hypothetical protein